MQQQHDRPEPFRTSPLVMAVLTALTLVSVAACIQDGAEPGAFSGPSELGLSLALDGQPGQTSARRGVAIGDWGPRQGREREQCRQPPTVVADLDVAWVRRLRATVGQVDSDRCGWPRKRDLHGACSVVESGRGCGHRCGRHDLGDAGRHGRLERDLADSRDTAGALGHGYSAVRCHDRVHVHP